MYEYSVMADCFSIYIKAYSMDVEQYLIKRKKDFVRLSITFEITEKKVVYDATFIYYDLPEYHFQFDEKNATFTLLSPWCQINNSTIFPMVFRIIVEWLRQKKQEIKLHASSVEIDGKTALFIAPSEGGKTTTALSLCHQHQFMLRSNDAAVVKFMDDIPYMLRGDTEFKVRNNGLAAYSSELYKEKIAHQSDSPWYDRTYLSAEEMGGLSGNNSSPVKAAFFVKLDTMVSGCNIIEYTDSHDERQKLWFKPKMMIMQNISGTLNGTDLLPLGNDGTILPLQIPSIDTPSLYQYRVQFLNKLFETCKIYQLRGQLEPIVAFIKQRML